MNPPAAALAGRLPSAGLTGGSTNAGPASGSPTENDIYDRMVAAILDHQLPPGTKLVEDRLAGVFGVSRTRIRPVLVRLANERVVTLAQHRGASVAQPTEPEAREVFEVRRLIEPTLVECFIARATPQAIDALARCIADEEAARAAGDHRRAIRLAGDFHLLLAQAAGHQTLGRILRELVSRTSLVLMAYGGTSAGAGGDHPPGCGCRDHRALLTAIRGGKPLRAARLMREHLARLEAQLQFPPTENTDAEPDLVRLLRADASGGGATN